MPPLISKGLVVIGGPKQAGKSIMASTVVPPGEMKSICCHDGENSMEEIRARMVAAGIAAGMNDVDFGSFVNLADRFSTSSEEILHNMEKGRFPWKSERQRGAMEDYFIRTAEAINNIEAGKCSIYIHEPADKLEAGVVAFALAHSGISERAPGGAFWLEGVYPVYMALFDILKKKGMELIILTAHEKTSTVRKGNRTVAIVNKVELAVKPELYKQAALMIYLVQDSRNESGAPAGLVLKERMPSMSIVDGKWKPRKLLPRRIPNCVWFNGDEPRGSIQWYMEHGADLANPHETEVWSAFEKDFLGEFLSKVQTRMMVADAERELREMGGDEILGDRDVDVDPKLLNDQAQLRDAMDTGLDIDDAIASILEKLPPPVRREAEGRLRAAAEGL